MNIYDFKAYMTPAILLKVTTITPKIATIGGIFEFGDNDKVSITPSPTIPQSTANVANIIFRKSTKRIIRRQSTKSKQNHQNIAYTHCLTADI